MNRLSAAGRRAVYLVLILVWLVVMLFPLLAFTLARGGQVRLGAQEGAHLRLFMVQADGTAGVGVERTGGRRGPDGTCRQTRVFFLLWDGQGEPARYCTCQTADGGLAVTPACPP